MSNKRTAGIIAGLGVAAAGAFAFWKYKTMTPEEKEQLKDKMNETGKKIKGKVDEMGDAVTKTGEKLKEKAEEAGKTISKKVEDVKGKVEEVIG